MAAITATAAAAAKDHVSKRQDTKKTQHPFLSSVLLFRAYRSSGTCTAYRIGLLKYRTGSEKYHRFFKIKKKKSLRDISMMPDRASCRAGPVSMTRRPSF